MKFLPICFNIENADILMVGGGKVAQHKLAALRLYTERITICAPEIHPEIRSSGLNLMEQAYRPEVLSGFTLVYACTNNAQLNHQVARDARTRGILVNIADDPERCDFVSPAIFKQGAMSVAVSSDATDVKLAIAWRDKIRDLLEPSSD